MPTPVRPARSADIPALVRLRLANAAHHVDLAPDIYRIPDPSAVRAHFEQTLSPDATVLISVAELSDEVVGMTELVLLPDPPAHQILTPRRAAEIHTVILPAYRAQGLGAALLTAAESTAAAHAVEILYAGIFTPNTPAAAFYTASGFTPRGTLLSKLLPTAPPAGRR